MPAIMTLQGPNLALLGDLRPVSCDPRTIDPAQLRLGTRVEMEHTADPAQARQIALHHLCEVFPRPYYIRGTGVPSERLLLSGPVGDTVRAHPWVIVLGLLAGGYVASRAFLAWGSAWGERQAAHKRETALKGPRRRRRKGRR